MTLKKYPIMSGEEYAKHSHDTPYLFELKKGKKHLFYFGTEHSADPKNPIYDQIRSNFKKLNPEIVVVEGVKDLNTKKEEIRKILAELTYDQAIKKYAESPFTVKLAFENNIDACCAEPVFKDEIKFVEDKGFKREEIFLYYMMRAMNTWFRLKDRPRLLEFLEYFYFEQIEKAANWNKFEFSYENFEKIHQEILGVHIQDNPEFYSERTDPIPWDKDKDIIVTNKIATQSMVYRDQNIVEKIEELLGKYDRIFVIFGASHAYMQEKALREIFDNIPQ